LCKAGKPQTSDGQCDKFILEADVLVSTQVDDLYEYFNDANTNI